MDFQGNNNVTTETVLSLHRMQTIRRTVYGKHIQRNVLNKILRGYLDSYSSKITNARKNLWRIVK